MVIMCSSGEGKNSTALARQSVMLTTALSNIRAILMILKPHPTKESGWTWATP